MADAGYLLFDNSRKHLGRVVISGILECREGIHFGAGKSEGGFADIDNVMVRDPLTLEPYGPGSSFKGKLVAVARRHGSAPPGVTADQLALLHKDPGRPEDPRCIQKNHALAFCPFCRLFGATAPEKGSGALTNAKFDDLRLTPASLIELFDLDSTVPYTEVKRENTVSYSTGEANPRVVERVPAGARFSFEIGFDILEGIDFVDDILFLLEALWNLEAKGYSLGGNGTRGYGRVGVVWLSLQVDGGQDVSPFEIPSDYQSAGLMDEVMKKIAQSHAQPGPGKCDEDSLPKLRSCLLKTLGGVPSGSEPNTPLLSDFLKEMSGTVGKEGKGWRLGSGGEMQVAEKSSMREWLKFLMSFLVRSRREDIAALLNDQERCACQELTRLFPVLHVLTEIEARRLDALKSIYANGPEALWRWYETALTDLASSESLPEKKAVLEAVAKVTGAWKQLAIEERQAAMTESMKRVADLYPKSGAFLEANLKRLLAHYPSGEEV